VVRALTFFVTRCCFCLQLEMEDGDSIDAMVKQVTTLWPNHTTLLELTVVSRGRLVGTEDLAETAEWSSRRNALL